MAAITLNAVEKRYEGAPTSVVKRVDLEIKDGEFVVLVGPSGCGKSTTLRMIAGLETITSGELLIDGKKSNDVAPGDRDLAMVFQSYALYPHMSVRENIAFGLKVRKMPSSEIAARTKEAATMLGLEELLDRKPKQLSGGQRQRVAMARAIVRRPKAFLFDEPLSNLDAKLRMEVRAEIATLRRTLGTTTVYVTHDQVEAMTLADRIVVLNEGIVQQVGAPLDLYRRPANQFVATFLGTPTMGLVPAALVPSANPPKNATTIGVRPHDARAVVAAAQPKPKPEHVRIGEVEVDLVERLGQESFAFGKLAGARVGALVDDADANANADPAMAALKAGQRVAIDVPRAKVSFFGADGTRIDT